MKYLKKFENHEAYTQSESGLLLPNVSLCVEENEVHFNPYVQPTHDWVEIAGVKWATMNIGASSETDYGNYYQYGKGARQYAETIGGSDYSGTENPLASSADTATQVWGDNWRMPTKAEFESLMANTNYLWQTNFNESGVNGGKFTDKTDSSKYVFFPAAGYYSGRLYKLNEAVGVWTSSYIGSNTVYEFAFTPTYTPHVSYNYMRMGFSIRPVFIGE